MLNQPNKPEDHARRVDGLVQRCLRDREVLASLMTGLRDERATGSADQVSGRVQAFCEALMDYVSAGHFEMYDELLAEAEQRGSQNLGSGIALYPQLQATTDAVLRFNDLHEGPTDAGLLASLPQELAELWAAVERRFGIEDRMIALLHESGTTKVTTA